MGSFLQLVQPYLRIPEEFLKTVDQTVSLPGPLGSQPEWGMMTMLTRPRRDSSMIVRFRSWTEKIGEGLQDAILSLLYCVWSFGSLPHDYVCDFIPKFWIDRVLFIFSKRLCTINLKHFFARKAFSKRQNEMELKKEGTDKAERKKNTAWYYSHRTRRGSIGPR